MPALPEIIGSALPPPSVAALWAAGAALLIALLSAVWVCRVARKSSSGFSSGRGGDGKGRVAVLQAIGTTSPPHNAGGDYFLGIVSS